MVVGGKKYTLPVSVFIEKDFKNIDPATAPRIEADKRYHNFGHTPAAQVVSCTYQIKNTGQTPLTIHRIYSNDERVTVEMTRKELKPGEAAALKVNTKSGADAGKVTCLISVISNAPANPELTLRFYGNID